MANREAVDDLRPVNASSSLIPSYTLYLSHYRYYQIGVQTSWVDTYHCLECLMLFLQSFAIAYKLRESQEEITFLMMKV